VGVLDKTGALSRLHGAHLELGCGTQKRSPESIGIDLLDLPCVDLVGDVYEVLAVIPSRRVSSISSEHFFEHLPDLDRVLAECARVLEPNGRMSVTVPHFSNPYFYSDPTHRAFFGLYSFAYLADTSIFRRIVPRYSEGYGFRLDDVVLVFRGERSTALSSIWNALLFKTVNSTRRAQEFYESKLSRLIACYEVTYHLSLMV